MSIKPSTIESTIHPTRITREVWHFSIMDNHFIAEYELPKGVCITGIHWNDAYRFGHTTVMVQCGSHPRPILSFNNPDSVIFGGRVELYTGWYSRTTLQIVIIDEHDYVKWREIATIDPLICARSYKIVTEMAVTASQNDIDTTLHDGTNTTGIINAGPIIITYIPFIMTPNSLVIRLGQGACTGSGAPPNDLPQIFSFSRGPHEIKAVILPPNIIIPI